MWLHPFFLLKYLFRSASTYWALFHMKIDLQTPYIYIYISIYLSYLKVMDTGFLNMLIGTSIVIWYLLHVAYECQLLYLRENKWIYLEANHLSVFLVISYFFLTCVISSYLKLLMVLSTGKKKWRWLISLLINM